MSFLKYFPYTNFHEINLDWILKNVKDLVADNIELHKDFDELADYIKNYLIDNLDEALDELLDELIESGQLDEMIMTAINDLTTKVNENSIPKFKYDISYIKTNDDTELRPVLCDFNPDRRSITYIAPYNDNEYVQCGDLADDYITPANQISAILFKHPNDITHCGDNHILLVADLTNELTIINAQTLTKTGTLPISWGGDEVIGVAYMPNTNQLLLMGSIHADKTNVLFAIAEMDGSIKKQWLIPIEKFHDQTYQDCYIQSLSIVDGQPYCLCSCLTPGGTSGNCVLLAIDISNECIKYSKHINIIGEAESIVPLQGEVLLYGFAQYPTSGKKASMVAAMTIAPRYSGTLDVYVDETQTLCGDGSNANPFNSINTAIYNAQNFATAQVVIYFKSDINAPFNIPAFRKNKIVFQGNNHKLNIVNRNFYGIDWVFYNTEFVRSSNNSNWFQFYRDSKLTLIDCTITRTQGNPLLRFMECEAWLKNLTINNSNGSDFGVIQNRIGSVIYLSINVLNMNVGDRAINNVDGAIINMKQIPTTFTNPISGDGVVLGKNQENLTNA